MRNEPDPRSNCCKKGKQFNHWETIDETNITPIFERDFARIAHLFTYREIRIMELLYGLNGKLQHTFDEVGRRYVVTPERIKQVQAQAVSLIGNLPPEAC
ncbi:MAG: hypothetical protein ACYC4D_00465 [Thermoleophilia bacterium]